jgi:arylsulfatase
MTAAAPKRARGLPAIAVLLCAVACQDADPVAEPSGEELPPLLLLITVDTLRADRLGAYGSDLGLTPRLDELAAESQVFLAANAPVPFTLPSIASLMTGRYPTALGIWSNESALPDDVPTLASALQARGWATAAVVGSWILREASGLARGFEHFDDEFAARERVRGIPERIAGQTSDAALAMLDRLAAHERSRFLWIHYQDPHGPYTPPGDHRARHLERERAAAGGTRRLEPGEDHTGFGALPDYQVVGDEREVAFYRAGYHGEVSYLDQELGRLLDGLAERDLLGRAVIAFTADHGESLGEGDQWFAHGQQLSAVQLRVPLILRVPGQAPSRRPDVVSLVDVFPTLLALAGAESSEALDVARDLLAPKAPASSSPVYLATLAAGVDSEIGWIEGDHKLTLRKRGDRWMPRLVRRQDDAPDTSSEAPERARRLHQHMLEFRSRFASAPAEVPQTITEDDAARLRALGYAPAP